MHQQYDLSAAGTSAAQVWRRVAGLSLAAGACAVLLVVATQVIFRKDMGEILELSWPFGLSASIAAAIVAPRFLRLRENQLGAARLLGTVGLGLTYLVFGVFTAVRDGFPGAPDVSVFAALPVFILLSAPVALPVTLWFSRLAHRLLNPGDHSRP